MGRLVQKRVGGIEFFGFSLGGEETVVAVPEFNICFDVGRAPREMIPIENVCLSHGHMDHAAGVAYYLSQRTFLGNAPGRIIVDKSLALPIQKLMDVWSDIEGHPSPGQIYGVEHLEEVPIRRGLLVRAFRVNHAAGALGFTLIETRHKLKEEFAGKTGPELVALKKEGVAIEHTVEIPLLTYTGDTAVGRFLDLDFVRQSRVMVMECTFFEREHNHRAKAGRHLHVDDLPGVLERLACEHVMLTHFSRRTDLRTAKRIIERVVGERDMSRMSILMERPPRRRFDAARAEQKHSESV
ncbi:MAG: MBL fold metallo-hydrolase [Phycisphaerae bacterium]